MPNLRDLHRMLYEPNTEGHLDGLRWTGYPGLFVQTRNNNQSWLLRWKVGGKTRVMGLGSCSKVTPRDAADAAARYMELIHQGQDPIAHRDRERAREGLRPVRARPDVVTFRDAARRYINAREGDWRDARTAVQWTQALRDYAYGTIGDLPLGDVTVDHLVDLLRPIWRTKNPTARKLIQRISQILDYAIVMGWLQGTNVAQARAISIRLGRVHHVTQHRRSIGYARAPELWQALARVDTEPSRALRFLMLTAARPREVTGAMWSEVDLGDRVWTIGAERMKMNREHRVPLADEAIEVLGQPGEGLLFEGQRRNGTISLSVLGHLIERMGFNGTSHGMRSVFTDWARETTDAHPETVELCLAHRDLNQTRRAYARGDLLETRRALMEQWARFLSGR